MILRPLEFEVKIAVFGDPRRYIGADGRASAEWEKAILAYAALPAPLPLAWDKSKYVRRFSCHRYLVKFFESAFARIHANPEAWLTVNDFGGCYEFRRNRRDPTALSSHAWGIGVDCDVLDNPQGKDPVVHPAVVEAFEAEGFLWGGRFKGKAKDGMHFEFVDIQRLAGRRG